MGPPIVNCLDKLPIKQVWECLEIGVRNWAFYFVLATEGNAEAPHYYIGAHFYYGVKFNIYSQ